MTNIRLKILLKLLAIVFPITLIAVLASNEDYKEELRELEHYCHMVTEGHWPDFKEIQNKECR